MSAQLTVSMVGNGPDAILQRAILATLPNDFRVADANADIVLVSGRDGHVKAALASRGTTTRAILLTSPASLTAADRALLARIEQQEGTAVVLGLAYAPWFATDGLMLDPALAEEVAILDLTAQVADVATSRNVLLEQLHIGRMMMGPLGAPVVLMDSPATQVVEVEGGSPAVKWRMTACAGLADELRVERIARGRRSKVVIAPGAHARPAEISHHDMQGSHVAMPVYQNGYRAAWVRLHADLVQGAVPSGALAQLEADVALFGWSD